jgi:hypothetical protein
MPELPDSRRGIPVGILRKHLCDQVVRLFNSALQDSHYVGQAPVYTRQQRIENRTRTLSGGQRINPLRSKKDEIHSGSTTGRVEHSKVQH